MGTSRHHHIQKLWELRMRAFHSAGTWPGPFLCNFAHIENTSLRLPRILATSYKGQPSGKPTTGSQNERQHRSAPRSSSQGLTRGLMLRGVQVLIALDGEQAADGRCYFHSAHLTPQQKLQSQRRDSGDQLFPL